MKANGYEICKGADLCDADLRKADLSGADLRGAGCGLFDQGLARFDDRRRVLVVR